MLFHSELPSFPVPLLPSAYILQPVMQKRHPQCRAQRIRCQIVPTRLATRQAGLVQFIGCTDRQRTKESQPQPGGTSCLIEIASQADQYGKQGEHGAMREFVPGRGNQSDGDRLRPPYEQASDQHHQSQPSGHSQCMGMGWVG